MKTWVEMGMKAIKRHYLKKGLFSLPVQEEYSLLSQISTYNIFFSILTYVQILLFVFLNLSIFMYITILACIYV